MRTKSQLSILYVASVVLMALIFTLTYQIPANANFYADEVIEYVPGDNVSDPYMNPSEALGVPENYSTPLPDGRATFVSLGINGSLTLGFFKRVIVDGPGTDFQMTEVGTAEKCNIYGSNDYGQTWVPMGISWGRKGYAAFDLAKYPALNGEVNAIKLEDGGLGERGAPFAGSDIDGVTIYNSKEVILDAKIDLDRTTCFTSGDAKFLIELPIGFIPEQIDVPTVEITINVPPDPATAQIEDNDGNGVNELAVQCQPAITLNVRGKLIDGMRFRGSSVIILEDGKGGGNGNQNRNREQDRDGIHNGQGNDHQDNGQHTGDKHSQQ